MDEICEDFNYSVNIEKNLASHKKVCPLKLGSRRTNFKITKTNKGWSYEGFTKEREGEDFFHDSIGDHEDKELS